MGFMEIRENDLTNFLNLIQSIEEKRLVISIIKNKNIINEKVDINDIIHMIVPKTEREKIVREILDLLIEKQENYIRMNESELWDRFHFRVIEK